jgi:hypothetical protein
MKRFILLALLVTSLGVMSAFAATAASAAPKTGSVAVPISAAQTGNVLDGVLEITGFALNSAGDLVASGTFTGTITDLATGVTTAITSTITAVITAPSASCSIIDLTLGPLHLDLLGLVVDLNQVHLTINAVPGPGNLLGNLLCTVANLLDNGVPTTALVNLLNNLIGQL